MFLRIRESGEEVSDSQLREMHPTKAIPGYLTSEVADALGADIIVEVPPPALAIGQVAEPGPAVLVEGVYQRSWNVVQSDESNTAIELSNAQSLAWEGIKIERTRRMLEGGVAVTVNTGVDAEGNAVVLAQPVVRWFETNVLDRGRYERMGNRAENMVSAGADLDDFLTNSEGNVLWKTMDNTWVPLTPGIVRSILIAIENRESALMKQGEAHRQAMLLAADPRSYDYSQGWVLSFGEGAAS